MTVINTLGIVAGLISTAAFLPQAVKVWRLQTTHGISSAMYLLYCLSLILWSVYGWMIESWPLLMTEILTGFMASYILLMTWRKEED